MARIKRSSIYWLLGTVAFWGALFAIDPHKGINLLIVSTVISGGIFLVILAFQIIRARLGY